MKLLAFSLLLLPGFSFAQLPRTQHSDRWNSSTLVSEVSDEASPKFLKKDLSDLFEPGFVAERFTFETATQAPVKLLTFRMPVDFDYEFAVLVVRDPIDNIDKIQRAYVISTAKKNKEPIIGIFRLRVPKEDNIPWPWRTSKAYENSPMYWALHIEGGYFIHSTSHYGNLGRPASMGCLRESLPDAMALFDVVANQYKNQKSMILLYEGLSLDNSVSDFNKKGAEYLKKVMQNSGWTKEILVETLRKSRAEALAVSKGDIEFASGVPVEAHGRPFSNQFTQDQSSFPKCGKFDCWKRYPRPDPITNIIPVPAILKLKPAILASKDREFKEVVVGSKQFSPGLAVAASQVINLNQMFEGTLTGLDSILIDDISIQLSSPRESILFRICEQVAAPAVGICSKWRETKVKATSSFTIPMHQIADKLSLSGKPGSAESLALEIKEGSGTLDSIVVQFLQQ